MDLSEVLKLQMECRVSEQHRAEQTIAMLEKGLSSHRKRAETDRFINKRNWLASLILRSAVEAAQEQEMVFQSTESWDTPLDKQKKLICPYYFEVSYSSCTRERKNSSSFDKNRHWDHGADSEFFTAILLLLREEILKKKRLHLQEDNIVILVHPSPSTPGVFFFSELLNMQRPSIIKVILLHWRMPFKGFWSICHRLCWRHLSPPHLWRKHKWNDQYINTFGLVIPFKFVTPF